MFSNRRFESRFGRIHRRNYLATFIGLFVFLAFAVIIIGGIVYAIDNVGMERQYGIGTVIDHKFIPAHYNVYEDDDGDITRTYVPDEWKIKIDFREHTDWISVSESFHDNMTRGSRVQISYVMGRLTSGFYLKSVSYLE